MRPTKRQVLETLSFGRRIAEDEADALSRYFVETETWRQLDAGEVDVVYAPKGGGKSALYALLTHGSAARRERGVIVVACEEVRGAPAFEQLKADPPTTEAEFRLLWSTYFLSLIARVLLDEQLESPEAKRVISRLRDLGLVDEPFTIGGMFRKAASLARRIRLEPQLTFDDSGKTTFSASARLEAPSPSTPGGTALLALFTAADTALEKAGLTVWLALDRLDVAFADEPSLETTALRSLFQIYRALEAHSRIGFKVFLRSDIWASLTGERFREASHITREQNLRWSPDTLLNLLVRRAAENIPLLEYYALDKTRLLESLSEQRSFCSGSLLEPVETPSRRLAAFDWLMTVLRDGTGRVSPRDVIHFMTNAREAQLSNLQLGGAPPGGDYMFGMAVYLRAFRDVAVFRMQRSFYAEHPKLRAYVEALEGAPSRLDVALLQRRWGIDYRTTVEISRRLSELGILEPRRRADRLDFRMPPLTQRGLTRANGI